MRSSPRGFAREYSLVRSPVSAPLATRHISAERSFTMRRCSDYLQHPPVSLPASRLRRATRRASATDADVGTPYGIPARRVGTVLRDAGVRLTDPAAA